MSRPSDMRLSFDQVPEVYDRARPSYPEQAFTDLFAYLGQEVSARHPAIVEVGPATGQATKALLDHGAEVTAVELGPNLAAFLQDKIDEHSHLTVVNSAFENVELPLASFDVILAATAYKWLDPATRIQKAVSLLRPSGVLATLSTIQIESSTDRGFFDRTYPIYQKYRPDEPETFAQTEEEAAPPEYAEFLASDLLRDVELHPFRWDQTYTTDSYEDLLRSYSDMQMMEKQARDALIGELRHVIDNEFGGTVVRPLVMALTVGRLHNNGSRGDA